MRWSVASSLLVLLVGAGCATVDPGPDYARAAEEVAATTGFHELFDPAELAEWKERVAVLAADGLTASDAAQIALLNNSRLRAAMYSLGVGRADVVQAGLFTNPSFGISYRLSSGPARVGLFLAQNIADLWQIPSRQDAAERQQGSLILQVAGEASELVAVARRSYWRTVGAERLAELAADAESLARTGLDVAAERHRAGSGTLVDVNLARSALSELGIEARMARLTAATARLELYQVLGIQDSAATLTLTPAPHRDLAGLPSDEELVDSGLRCRLDLKAAERAVAAAEAAIAYQERRLFQSVNAGVDFERDDQDSIGPAIELSLPIFDQNQAQISRAQFEYLRVTSLRDALACDAEQEILTFPRKSGHPICAEARGCSHVEEETTEVQRRAKGGRRSHGARDRQPLAGCPRSGPDRDGVAPLGQAG